MSDAVKNLMNAVQRAMEVRPKVGGFPYLAEALRLAGVSKNIWHLPSCQSLYITKYGPVIMQGTPLVNGAVDVAPFNQEKLIHALRVDQAGKGTFPEFLNSSWLAGVIRYEVDFLKRNVSYYGCSNELYLEEYPEVKI